MLPFGANVQIDGSSRGGQAGTAYEQAVQGLLTALRNQPPGIGAAVLATIESTAAHGRTLRVVPVARAELTAAAARRARRAHTAGSTFVDDAGQTLVHPGDDPDTPAVEHAGDPIRGLGGGSDVELRFDPAHWSGRDLGPGTQTLEVLLHELVHAARMMQGHASPSRMGDGFDRVEEYYAVLVTNVVSSFHRRPLRADHFELSITQLRAARGVLGALPATNALAFRTPEEEDERFGDQIHAFVNEEPRIAQAARAAACDFNPFAVHLNTPAERTARMQRIRAELAARARDGASRTGYEGLGTVPLPPR